MFDFIFSNSLTHRIARHIIFWLVWWCYFVFAYQLPNFWFVGWIIDPGTLALTERLGYSKLALLVFLTNFTGSVPVHMLFTYVVLYFLAPRYLYKGKYWAMLTGIVMLLLVSMVTAYYEFIWFYGPIQNLFGINVPAYSTEYILYCIAGSVLFNCPTVAGVAVGVKLFKRYYVKENETGQVAKEKVRAELKLLKAQIHPHFLFNTLNNIYFFSLTAPVKAAAMVKKLSGMLDFILNEGNKTLVPVQQELRMIQDYMALEKIRYGDQLNMNISIQGRAANKMIAPLLLIPIVENSFKHGTSKMLAHPWVTLEIIISEYALDFRLVNSKVEEFSTPRNGGIGLANVRKRLQLLYPGLHVMTITEDALSFSVFLRVHLEKVSKAENALVEGELAYEMA